MSAEQLPYPPPARAWYAVAVLTLAYVSSFVDRMMLNLLVDPIRRDMSLSDTQISLLMGVSFAVFYTCFGLPLGRLADTTNRSRLIMAGIAVWSLMTAACGLVRSYGQFLLARMGVGVGEAALSPAAYSMITDSFPRERLATAMSVYSTGICLGSGAAMLVGALSIRLANIQEVWTVPIAGRIFPWQMVFFIVGLPGLLVALLMLTVREPARRGPGSAASIPLPQVVRYMRANGRAFGCHMLGFGLFTVAAYAAAAWAPTVLVRIHGLTAVEAGVALGLFSTVLGTAGVLAGGRLADRLAPAGRPEGRLRVGLISSLALVPAMVAFALAPRPGVAVALLAPISFFSTFPLGAASAALQELTPARMRGQASALYLLVVSLLGLGLGPTLVALTTDYVFRDDLAVAASLGVVGVAALATAALVLRAGLAPYRETCRRLAAWNPFDLHLVPPTAGIECAPE